MGWIHLSIYVKLFMEILTAKITTGFIYAANTRADILHTGQSRQLRILLIVLLIQAQPTQKTERNLTFAAIVRKYQSRRSGNQRSAGFATSQSEKVIAGHQSTFGTQEVRYSDIVTGSHKSKYNVPTQNKYAPLN